MAGVWKAAVLLFVAGMAIRTGFAVDDATVDAGSVVGVAIGLASLGLLILAFMVNKRRAGRGAAVALACIFVVIVLTPEAIIYYHEGSWDWVMIPGLVALALLVYPVYRWRYAPAKPVEPGAEERRSAFDAARARQRSLPTGRRHKRS